MRLFVAVEAGSAIASAASALLDELRARVSRLAPGARISWVPPERLHLTLRFIGEADEPTVRAIERVLRAPFELSPFEVTVSGVAAFPPRGRPRVLAAATTSGRDALDALVRQLASRLEHVGLPRADRPFRPHVTLARVREAAGLRSRPLFAGLSDVALGAIRVDASTLFESRLAAGGPVYVPLQRTALTGSPHAGGDS